MAKELVDQIAGRELAGIGVGVPELVDPSGDVTSDQTIAWRGVRVQEEMARLAPTCVESDVRAAALAEAVYGAGRNLQSFVYVTIGTGISSCLVQEGRPYTGARGNALVFASGFLTFTCPTCGQVTRFVLEEYASGPALVDRYQRRTGRRILGAEEVLAGVDAGDAAAVEVVRTAGKALGAGIGWLVNVLDPEAVIVGGGLGLAGGLYWSSMVESTRSHIWAEAGRDLPILTAATGVDAGIIGAAAAAQLLQGARRTAPTH
jgi:glucokinase